MAPIRLNVNGEARTVDVSPETPLLWVLRDTLGLTGTKYGCGIGQCAACTVHIDGEPMRSCRVTASAAANATITTIEGLATGIGRAVQAAWIAEEVPQCGYCQSGQVMAATALLTATPRPSGAQINEAMDRNMCRCGTYERVRRAIHRAVTSTRAEAGQ